MSSNNFNEEKAYEFSNPHCAECGGAGWVFEKITGVYKKYYCYCALERMDGDPIVLEDENDDLF